MAGPTRGGLHYAVRKLGENSPKDIREKLRLAIANLHPQTRLEARHERKSNGEKQ